MMLLHYQCPYSVISGRSVCGTWLKLFSKKGSLSGKGASAFLKAPFSMHRRKQRSLFPPGTIIAWFQEASQAEFRTLVKQGDCL